MESLQSNTVSAIWVSSDGPLLLPNLPPNRRATFSAARESAPACARTRPGPSRAPVAPCVMVSQWMGLEGLRKLVDSLAWVSQEDQDMGQ